MKAFIKPIIAATLALMAAASCDKNEAQTPENFTLQITPQIANPLVKSTLTPNEGETAFVTTWEKDDQMDVTIDGKDYVAEWTGEHFAIEALPSSLLGKAISIEAGFPAVKDSEDQTASTQRTQMGNACNTYYDVIGSGEVKLTVGKDGKVSLPMKRKTAILYYHITSTETSALSKAELTLDDKTIVNTIVNANAADAVIWFNVTPGTYNTVSLTLTIADGRTVTIAKEAALTTEAGTLYKEVKSVEFKSGEQGGGEGGEGGEGGGETSEPKVYASLAELVASGEPTADGEEVTVTLKDEAITKFYTSSKGLLNGIYLLSGETEIEIYKTNGTTSTVPETWAVGGTVSGTIKGYWKNYKGTWEVDMTSDGMSDFTDLTYVAPAITKKTPTLTVSGNKTSMSTSDAANIFDITYDGDGALSVASSNTNAATVSLSGTTVTVTPAAAGTTTITISAAEGAEYLAAKDVKYTLTISEPVEAAALPFEFDKGKADLTIGMAQTGLGGDYGTSPKLKFDSTGDNLIIHFDRMPGVLSYSIKGNTFSGGTFDVLESADDNTYTTVASHTSLGDTQKEAHSLKEDSRYVKFIYTTKSAGNVALGNIKITDGTVEADPELAFEQSSYLFHTTDEVMKVTAVSAAHSAGAITYSLTSGDSAHFTIAANDGTIQCDAVGTYTVTANIASAKGFTAGSASCTVVVKETMVANSAIVAEWQEGDAIKCVAMSTTLNSTYFVHVQLTKVGDKYYLGTASKADISWYTSTADGKTSIQNVASEAYVRATAEKNVNYTTTEYLWGNDGTKLSAESATHGTLQYNTGSPRFTTYAKTVGKYAKIVSLDDILEGAAPSE